MKVGDLVEYQHWGIGKIIYVGDRKKMVNGHLVPDGNKFITVRFKGWEGSALPYYDVYCWPEYVKLVEYK